MCKELVDHELSTFKSTNYGRQKILQVPLLCGRHITLTTVIFLRCFYYTGFHIFLSSNTNGNVEPFSELCPPRKK